ncbi:methylosome protein 50-like isoform X2 [Biomphalaria glabrata]|uniref:Methylosome protein 50-like isoform X2 n=1 Tax=Biomphalaria glabrata TaxID=6526 RepID=A0A9U8E777_BIOGL|nr:methylosome protein 50-like isoform X2 [Biomphalaria glabrata]
MPQNQIPAAMDRHLDVLHCHADGGLLLGASCLTGRFWLGSLWYYQTAESAPDVDRCTAGVQLEAGVGDAKWIDNTHVLVGLDTGGIAVWNLEDDFRTFVLSHAAVGHDGVVTSVSVTCDKTKAASSSHDRCIKLWDLSNTVQFYTTQAHSDIVYSIDCHPNESDLFVSCSQDGRILVWDRRKVKPASILNKSPLQYTPTCVKWRPDNPYKLAVGSESGQIVVLDTRAGVDNSYLNIAPHKRLVNNLQFCPNKPSLLASVSEDCKVVVCTTENETMKVIYSNTTHRDFVRGLTWSTESQLYTCAWDSRILLHDITKQTATFMGESSSCKLEVNGDIADHPVENGSGDVGTDVDKSKLDQCKLSYSQAVKSQPEMSAEG